MTAESGRCPPVPLARVTLRGRCPRCGRGALYQGYLKVADKCEVCGLELGRHDSADGPAVFVIFLLGFLVMGLVFWVEMTYSPPYWVHAVVWPPVILGGVILMLRPLKGLFVALQYRHRAEDYESDR